MSQAEADLDKKLTDLLKVMVARLPEDKKLSVGVVQQLLRAKYSSVFSESYVSSHEAFLRDAITRLMAERDSSPAANASGSAKRPASESASESDDSDSDSDDDDDDDDNEDEEDDDSEDTDDEDDDEENELGSSSSDEEDAEPDAKKTRLEEETALDAKDGSADVTEQCKGMVSCLRKLSYRVRGPEASESLEDYLHKYLVAEFRKHGMDPTRYSATDIKRYRVQREVELLQQDGAQLSLDKRNRVGRGYAGVSLQKDGTDAPPASTAYPSSKFLDDE